MFSKVFASAAVLLAISAQVNAHAAIAPALGVSGTPARSDVQRPSTAKPCGTIDVASTIDTSTPIQAAADGTFTATVTDFNAGADGSRSVSGTVDATGAGTSFAGTVTVSKNGDAAPTTVGSDQITAALPAGTTCTGGTAGNLCLVSFKTTAGFGNCVVVAQGAGTGAAATGAASNTTVTTDAASNTTTTTDTTGATNGTTTTATTGQKHHHGAAVAKAAKAAAAQAAGANGAAAGTNAAVAKVHRKAAGTRSARALLAELEARGEETLAVAKRGLMSWVWA